MKHRKKPFYATLFRTLFTPICIIIICLLITIAVLTDSLLLTNVTSKYILLANNSCALVERSLNADANILENLAANPQIKSTLRTLTDENYLEIIDDIYKSSQILQVFNHSQPKVANVTVFSPKLNNPDMAYSNFLPLSVLAESTRFASYTSLHSAIIPEGAPYMGANNGNDTISCDYSSIALLTEIDDSDGTMLGYLCSAISKEYIYSNFLSISDPSIKPILITNSGKIIISGKTQEQGADISSRLDPAIAMPTSGYFSTSIEGIPHYVMFSQSNAYGYRVAICSPKNVLCPWKKYIYLLLAFSILLSVMLSYFYSKHFSKKITNPISDIIKAMKDSNRCAEEQSITEFNNLITMYNTMLDEQAYLVESLKSQSQKAQNAEINAMLAQINPHFLYNTLNAIGYHALDGDSQLTCELLSKLARLCRINYQFNATTTIAHELLQINLYLDLQLKCFNHSFEFSIDSPEECDNCIIPSFILQPIVENSIIHGFSQTNRDGKLYISIRPSHDDLIITVRDNGSGIPNDILDTLNTNTYHSDKYGIYNICNRIKSICGERYGIEFRSDFSWTSVIITLPKTESAGDEDV